MNTTTASPKSFSTKQTDSLEFLLKSPSTEVHQWRNKSRFWQTVPRRYPTSGLTSPAKTNIEQEFANMRRVVVHEALLDALDGPVMQIE
jgi:hypothetical protein